MRIQNQGLRVKEGKTKITVTHNRKDLTFLYPAHGLGNYVEVGKEIEKANLKKPTMAETASLAHAAFDSTGKYSKEIMELMEKNWLWVFTGTLYVPNNGAFIQDNPEIRDGMPYMEESDLVNKLEKNDPSVRFVPFGYKIGDLTPKELEKNKYVIALAGEEGASKLAEVAEHRDQLMLWGFGYIDELTTRVSVARFGWDDGGHWMGLGGGRYGNWCSSGGFAFGVQKKTRKRKG